MLWCAGYRTDPVKDLDACASRNGSALQGKSVKYLFWSIMAIVAMSNALASPPPPPPPPVPPGYPRDVRDAVPVSQNPAPIYPPELACSGLTATTTVILLVNSAGVVIDQYVEGSSGNRLLDKSALLATKQWKFKPSTEDGVPVAQRVRIPISFDAQFGKPAYCSEMILTLAPAPGHRKFASGKPVFAEVRFQPPRPMTIVASWAREENGAFVPVGEETRAAEPSRNNYIFVFDAADSKGRYRVDITADDGFSAESDFTVR